jgi:hypothetical protein
MVAENDIVRRFITGTLHKILSLEIKKMRVSLACNSAAEIV